jgi:uncharacterized protein YgiM (DUF1202 family)
MFGFGNDKKKEEEAKAQQEQIAQSMKAMSDQIGKQAQTIKALEDQLAAAKGNAAISSATSEILASAQAELKQLHAELDKLKANAAAPAPHGGKESASAGGSGAIGAIGGAKVSEATHSEAPIAAPAATGGLALGVTAYVQKAGGKNLRLRDKAGLESHVSDSLRPGTQLTLLIGPVERDGYPWWRIRTADGREGWVAGTELVTHPE